VCLYKKFQADNQTENMKIINSRINSTAIVIKTTVTHQKPVIVTHFSKVVRIVG